MISVFEDAPAAPVCKTQAGAISFSGDSSTSACSTPAEGFQGLCKEV